MKTLIVASTQLEVNKYIFSNCVRHNNNLFINKMNKNTSVLITGVGSINMAVELSLFLSKNSNFSTIMNIGIGGTYNKNTEFGKLFNIASDYFPEIGIINEIDNIAEFNRELFEHKAVKPSDLKNIIEINPKIYNSLIKLNSCNALTVNSCTNNKKRSDYFESKYNALIESMEGAAFFEVCNKFNFNFFQVRAVSNFIPQNSIEDWNIKAALESIDSFLNEIS